MSKISPQDLEDMQRLILQGLGRYRAARYCLFHIPEGELDEAQQLLRMLLKYIATANKQDRDDDEHRDFRICIAFTWKGLQRFGLNEKNLHNVPLAFKEGMGNDIRSARLKDHPGDWEWSDARGLRENDSAAGSKERNGSSSDKKKDIHLLIAGFSKVGKDDDEFTSEIAEKVNVDWKEVTPVGGHPGLECIWKLPDAFIKKSGKGHFGFLDGISQPYIEGSGTSKKPVGKFADVHIIKPGEFILGHRNEFAQHIPPLWVEEDISPGTHILKQDGLEYDRRDFGRNGSYLVFRQIRQRKREFDKFLKRSVANPDPGEITDKELVAAKLVGRWRSGAPLTLAPEKDNLTLTTANDFLYDSKDRHGYKCPIGAHIRRSYPRDSIIEHGSPVKSEGALSNHRRRRMIRRGRPYYDLEDEENVGLHFICLNADIREQFEFVQESWINNPRFGSTRDEVDPLVGSISQSRTQSFTVQRSPVSQSLNLAHFVEVVGGGYFFLPSKRALNFLIDLKLGD